MKRNWDGWINVKAFGVGGEDLILVELMSFGASFEFKFLMQIIFCDLLEHKGC